MPTPPPNTPPPCLAILTWAEAPAATAVGYGCLRWGAIRPAGVAAVVSKVTDRVRDPRGIWWFVSLGLLSIGDFPRHGQENHMVTPTVWTYNRRFWREGQRPCEPPKGTHHVDTPPPIPVRAKLAHGQQPPKNTSHLLVSRSCSGPLPQPWVNQALQSFTSNA